MLHTSKLMAALETKRERFLAAESLSQADLEALQAALAAFQDKSRAAVEAEISCVEWPGARPTVEQDTQPLIVPFNEAWSNHRQARSWALEVLRGVTTFAADGSQISRSTDVSIRVGVVQVGWFENCHMDDGQGDYVKDIEVEVLAPDELAGEESGFADNEVEWRRFRGEIEHVKRFMLARADRSDSALAFFDGSLIISFVQHMTRDRQHAYVHAIQDLLEVSEQTRVPLVGYVDTSYADDLTSLISRLSGLGMRGAVSDAALLRPLMSRWGDRCRLYQCARDDAVLPLDGHKYYGRVVFAYLKTTADSPPARLELPTWVLEAGRHEWVLNAVRAECVVGTGYPYALETADAVAVLTARDRERFLALFQQFAEQEGLPLRFSRKAVSKRGRRL
jgi:hypothetical protein